MGALCSIIKYFLLGCILVLTVCNLVLNITTQDFSSILRSPSPSDPVSDLDLYLLSRLLLELGIASSLEFQKDEKEVICQ